MQHRTGSNKWRKKVNGQLPIVGLPGKQLLKPDVSEWLEVWGWTPGSDCFFTPEKPHFMCRAIYEVVGASKWCHNILMSSQYIDVITIYWCASFDISTACDLERSCTLRGSKSIFMTFWNCFFLENLIFSYNKNHWKE